MKNKMTLDEIQINLRNFMGDKVRPGTKKSLLVEHSYIKGLRDAGVEVPAITEMLIFTGRSIATFKPTNTFAD